MKKILICHIAHIGDVVASLPIAYAIKQHWPQCKVTYLCTHYTASTCKLGQDIDDILIWDDISSLNEQDAINLIKQQNFSAVIHAGSRKAIASLMRKAKVKIRIDKGYRLDILLNSNRVQPSWKHLEHLHQAQMNLRLLKGLNITHHYERHKLSSMIRIKTPALTPNIQKHLDPQRFNIVLHPYSSRHQGAREWPLDYFYKLTRQLDQKKYHIIITGSAVEGERLKDTPLNDPKRVTNLCGNTNLTELFILLAHVDGLVVCGTGPLHLAAALGTHCLGLFSKKKLITTWEALGPRTTSIATDKPCPGSCSITDCACMRALTPQMVHGYIEGWYLARQQEKAHTLTLQEQDT